MNTKTIAITTILGLGLMGSSWARSPRSQLSYKKHEFGKNVPTSNQGYAKHLKIGPASKRH